MKISGNTILVTGGGTGIGYALAEKFAGLGNEVIICGRRENKLEEAKARIPALHTIKCDISKDAERQELCKQIAANFSGINVLVNNAGIQRRIDLSRGADELLSNEDEIEINLRSQIYLAARFVPMLIDKDESAIINVSSGLGFVPIAAFPVYSATKAAIHSFTKSLRQQLKDTRIKVFEVIPPGVYDTELKGKPMPKSDWSISAKEMADAVLEGLGNDQYEIAAGTARGWVNASRNELDKAFENTNNR